ncbi:hypothetical protein BGZ65_012305 [Modicella reniformis]|uniref:Fungal lipase-type domain-containing protein n=1 Tax=Modicella reniformis TaxID=1440133 RepID=A0A9P6J5E4_9FUNG|nr:hypothetical protein BGZ65_012305 [Modicella reniformis]
MPIFDLLVQIYKHSCLYNQTSGHIELQSVDDPLSPFGSRRSIRQLESNEVGQSPHFSYYIAHVLLVMSSEVYVRHGRDSSHPNPVRQETLLHGVRDTERLAQTFGMRFHPLYELKTRGGPASGLFYNADTIVLVYKGTTITSFDECLIDVTLQRLKANEYLYGEVHEGFYNVLFEKTSAPDNYEYKIHGPPNPIKFVMESIFLLSKRGRRERGKPLNLWITGHSLGGALASLTMARLQKIVGEHDPIVRDQGDVGFPALVVMLRQFTRNYRAYMACKDCEKCQDSTVWKYGEQYCYTMGSPRVGDSTFAEEYARNERSYCVSSIFKPVYWRLANEKDIVPRLPLGRNPTQNNYQRLDETPHMHSLLDYQHVGQLVEVRDTVTLPKVQPSAFEDDLSEGVLRARHDVNNLVESFDQLIRWLRQQQDPDLIVRTLLEKTSQIRDDILMVENAYGNNGNEARGVRGVRGVKGVFGSAHSTSTYQNNLIIGRFFFKTYPGFLLDDWPGH